MPLVTKVSQKLPVLQARLTSTQKAKMECANNSETPIDTCSAPMSAITTTRELRDMIYDYALTEDAGLVARPSTPGRLYAAGKDDESDVNRLRFCFNIETKGLGLRYDDITFADFDLLEDFITNYCGNVRFKCIEKVSINKPSRNFGRHAASLAFQKLCQAYPFLKITVCIDWLSSSANHNVWRYWGGAAQ